MESSDQVRMLAQIVEEVLEKLATPARREHVMRIALGLAGEAALPCDVRKLVAFVTGPLCNAASRELGPAAAEILFNDVCGVMEHALRVHRTTLPPPSSGAISLPPAEEETGARHTPSGVHEASGTPPDSLAPESVRVIGSGVPPSEAVSRSGPAARRGQRPIRGATLPYTPHDSALVLLVDDDTVFLRGLGRLLSAEGYDVVTAPDGDAALRLCQRLKPHLLITDLDMPEPNGEQLAALVATTLGAEAPTVLVLTGQGDPPAVPFAARVATKSLRTSELVAAVAELVAVRKAKTR